MAKTHSVSPNNTVRRKMLSPRFKTVGKVFRIVLAVACVLMAPFFAFAGLFAAIGGPDGKFGSRESLQWAAAYLIGFLLCVAAAILLLKKRKKDCLVASPRTEP